MSLLTSELTTCQGVHLYLLLSQNQGNEKFLKSEPFPYLKTTPFCKNQVVNSLQSLTFNFRFILFNKNHPWYTS